MTKGLRSRLDRLERHVAPQQVICLLDTPENRRLVAAGFLPIDALLGEPGGEPGGHRRLRKSESVLFLLEIEMGL
jgi:hypothetical protein